MPVKKKVKPVPTGYRTVTPYICVKDAGAVLEFVKKAFGAKEKFRSAAPDGTVHHAEVKIGDSMVMVGGVMPGQNPLPAAIYLYVKDCDKAYKAAIKAGAKSLMKPANQFYGDRNGGVQDSQGVQWWIGTHIEDVSPKELKRRAAEQGKK